MYENLWNLFFKSCFNEYSYVTPIKCGVLFFLKNNLKEDFQGQQLLRMGIRRKSERNLVQELYVSNGGSKKALVDKLLSALTIWNFRATLFDLSLMIKEVGFSNFCFHFDWKGAADHLVFF